MEIVEAPRPVAGPGELVVRLGRFGKFYACSKFPECKHTEPLEEHKPKSLEISCPKCKYDDIEICIHYKEERRLYYVAMTRAMHELFLTFSVEEETITFQPEKTYTFQNVLFDFDKEGIDNLCKCITDQPQEVYDRFSLKKCYVCKVDNNTNIFISHLVPNDTHNWKVQNEYRHQELKQEGKTGIDRQFAFLKHLYQDFDNEEHITANSIVK